MHGAGGARGGGEECAASGSCWRAASTKRRTHIADHAFLPSQSINYNHLLPTRYALELEGLKGSVAPETFKEPTHREEAKKQIKKILEERYIAGKNKYVLLCAAVLDRRLIAVAHPGGSSLPSAFERAFGVGCRRQRGGEGRVGKLFCPTRVLVNEQNGRSGRSGCASVAWTLGVARALRPSARGHDRPGVKGSCRCDGAVLPTLLRVQASPGLALPEALCQA